MTILKSDFAPTSEDARVNRAAHLDALAQVRAAAEAARRGGGPTALARHVSRGKLPPRARIEALLDPGAPFLEIGVTAAHDMYDGACPGSG
ncbi:MAG: 3-methylcrotonyl-CoA carboxylase beta subunit, partial [Paracoccaceae bacterium]